MVLYIHGQKDFIQNFFSRGNTLNFGFSYSLSLGSRNPLGQQKVKKKLWTTMR